MIGTHVTGFSLDGRAVVVTGGASGIGAGIAQVMAEAGALVVIADVQEERAAAQASAIRDMGGTADHVAVNLADEASIVAACADIVHRHGAPWALVNNAGIQDRELLVDGTADHWDRTHSVNARAPYLMTRELARAMVAAGTGGRIVNVGSVSLIGQVIKGLVPYAASKAALTGLTLASAFELAEHGITVNMVNPGGVATPGAITAKGPPPEGPGRRACPLGMCEPRDIAAAVLLFVSPAARMMTNQTLTVDAGFSVS